MAGKPPAAAFQPSGINGIMVIVMIKVTHEPVAPRMPSFLFQKPRKISAPNNHSETPRNQLEPWRPKTGYIQEIKRPIANERYQRLRFVREPLLVSKREVDDHHRCADDMVIEVLGEKAEFS